MGVSGRVAICGVGWIVGGCVWIIGRGLCNNCAGLQCKYYICTETMFQLVQWPRGGAASVAAASRLQQLLERALDVHAVPDARHP